jgi:lipoate-protein ligase A
MKTIDKIIMKYLLENIDTTDPAINLATEEFIVRNFDISHDYVLLYVNQPAVVVGRHQNIYEEVNLPFLMEQNIPVFRRFSGGGTVFHDPGNLNFSFITRYEKFKFNNYRYFNQPVVDFLNQLGLPVVHTEGNDIVISNLKISGSAQFTSRDRMVSHGTLLFNSDLDVLSGCLKVPDREIISRATKSRRRPVTNISGYLKESMSLDRFREKLLKHLFNGQDDIPRIALKKSEREQIYELAEGKYRRWDWTYGESPECTIKSSVKTAKGEVHCRLEISKGHIREVAFEGPGITIQEAAHLNVLIKGVRFYPEVISGVVGADHSLDEQKVEWLKKLLL